METSTLAMIRDVHEAEIRDEQCTRAGKHQGAHLRKSHFGSVAKVSGE